MVIALIPWFELHVGERRAIARNIRGAGMDAEAVVHIIDDDASLHDALGSLFRSVGLKICSYGSARDFIDAYRPDAPSCIVLDVRLPGISGIDFQAQLADLGIPLPAAAIDRDRARRAAESKAAGIRNRFATLSAREQQVMALVTAGMMNKQMAGDLGLSEITIKNHRGAAMRKMGARTLADLVRMAELLSLRAP
jgi:FixJ family two-component response regulator